MALHHAFSGEIVDLRPLGAPLVDTQSTTVLRDAQLKVMRIVLPAGKQLPAHAVDGPITMHCLEGEIDVIAHGCCKTMRSGDFMYLAGEVRHALCAKEDSAVLVSIVIQKPQQCAEIILSRSSLSVNGI